MNSKNIGVQMGMVVGKFRIAGASATSKVYKVSPLHCISLGLNGIAS